MAEARRARDRWRRLVNRAVRAYRLNAPPGSRVEQRATWRRLVMAGDRQAREWARLWGSYGA